MKGKAQKQAVHGVLKGPHDTLADEVQEDFRDELVDGIGSDYSGMLGRKPLREVRKALWKIARAQGRGAAAGDAVHGTITCSGTGATGGREMNKN